MSIGPNGSKPIFEGWERVQQKFQPAFGSTFDKFFKSFQFVESALGLQSISLLGNQQLKPPSIMNASKKVPGLGSSGKGK